MRETSGLLRFLRPLLWGLLVAVGLSAGAAPPGTVQGSGARVVPGGRETPPEARAGEGQAMTDSWKEVERLVSEQKFREAAERVAGIREEARAAGDAHAWARALIREVQLRTALGEFEGAVRFLRQQPWPEDPLERAVLELFYAHSLITYRQAYGWEIEQRERTVSREEPDLAAWTARQIFAEAQEACLRVWQLRESWGGESIGTLAEHLEQNTYPARIRGTLRDAVTYIWVEALGNTALWPPEASNEIFRLDLERLLSPEPAAEADLADPGVHPLVKIAALLADLEAWHRRQERPEAAFEAHLERLRRLADSFTRGEDRRRLRADLEARLDELDRHLPWWSMGQAELAGMVRGEDDPWSLTRAREIALEGERAHPESIGGERCRRIAAEIEAPSYAIAAMAADGLDRRSIEVTHANLGALYFRAYRLDVEAAIRGARDWNLLPSYREVPAILAARQPDLSWGVDLPETPDFRRHRTFVTPPFSEPGAYLVVASARKDFSERLNQRLAVNLFASDLVLVDRRRDGATYEVTALSGDEGAPLAGVEIDLYRFDWRRGHRRVETRATGEDGTVAFTLPQERGASYFLFAHRGEDLALDQSGLRVWHEPEDQERTSALVYTDRSVYRPRQTVLWKVVAYRGEAGQGRYQTLPEASLQMELLDPNGQSVATAEASTNRFGSASGRFELPPGGLLGSYRLRVLVDGQEVGSSWVAVEEYKRPTFEVTVEDPEDPLRLNRPVTLGASARYYFGLPVAGGSVTWQVTREPIYPRWFYSSIWPPPTRQTQVLAAGEAEVGPDGTFAITFTPEADEREASQGVTYQFRLSADVTDEGGETRSASRLFRVGFTAVQAAIETGPAFFRRGEPVAVTIRRTDLNGVPRAGRGSWRLVALEQPLRALLPAEQPLPRPPFEEGAGEAGREPYRTPGDGLRPRWASGADPGPVLRLWEDGPERDRGTVEHDTTGEASLELPRLAPGAYRLHYATRDPFGAEYETSEDFIVAREGRTPLALPVVLLAERGTVAVGETARFLVHSGLPGQRLELEIFRDGRRRERRNLSSESGLHLLEIPVGPEDRGGFGVRLTALADHQLMTATQEIQVPWDDRRLEVSFASFRDLVRPGARETWRVEVKGADGEALAAGAAELLAYMYDRSLDLFAPHHPPEPLGLYPRRTGIPPMGSTLGTAQQVWQDVQSFVDLPPYPGLEGDRLKFFDAYGIGGPGRGGGMRYMQRGVATQRMLESAEASADATITVTSESPLLEQRKLAAEPEAASPPPPPGEPGSEPPPPEEPPRSDFAETAFWEPHLVLGEGGAVAFEFTVPDSVTEWNVWVHALTRDLRSGSLHERTRSAKDLLVRPYLPRFLREGDRAALKVVVNNASEEELSGTVDFAVEDPETGESLLADFGLDPAAAQGVPFTVAAGGGANLTFPVVAPTRIGEVAFRVTARAGGLSDGELRPLPVLPGRVHLAQSRFAALSQGERRTLTFEDLAAGGDPTLVHDQLVVTVDAQLFYGVLAALPYLVDYPYECTEQTLNRFLSTGIVSSLFDRYPGVAEMARRFASRETPLEAWDAPDPNRKMALEETPWLVQARGGEEPDSGLIRVLDPEVARAQRSASLAALEEAQTSIGAFPWFPGGPPSPHMTLYILGGLARALEFDVEVPQQMVVRAWSYVHRYYLDELARTLMEEDRGWELVTLLNYVLSTYPDDSWTGGVFTADDRSRMLEHSFAHWRQHSPLLKGYLALTLERAGRDEDAHLVWDSVMDSARTDPDLGTYWAPEDRSWLWYNDTIETHAFALTTLTELDPGDARRHGLVEWLFLNKHLNHWKSTRATAEVIYALVHYLEHEGALAAREEVKVTAGPVERTFVYEPDRYTGADNQVVIPGEEVEPSMAEIRVAKEGPGFAFAAATWHFSTEELPAEARGDFFQVTRTYFRRLNTGEEWVLEPLAEGAVLAPGDQVEVHLSLASKHAAEYVHLRDPRGAGFEPEAVSSGYKWDLGIGWYEEVRDSGTNFFFERLPVGEYTLKYRLRANLAGTFRIGPATVQSLYAPELTAYSSGAVLTVAAGDGR